ncbi:hypothetical protein ACPYO6_01855 [Georgenia sp. Z1344]|uniref:hypothetical protein n=1 Tax=Georgenia sp. Z1344 TaxID=3416706 RepID=UPI003CE869E0
MTSSPSGRQRSSGTDGATEPTFPPGASTAERNALRLDHIATKGWLEIPRGRDRAYIVRIVGCVLLGLLGLVVLLMGAEGTVAMSALVFVVVFGVVFPVVHARRLRHNYLLELTPEDFTLFRWVDGDKQDLHRVPWRNVVLVTTVRFGKQLESPSYPSVIACPAFGIGRRPVVRTALTREIRGERVTIDQPLAIDRGELVELLRAANERFGLQTESSAD